MARDDRGIKWEGTCSRCGRPARVPFVPRDPARVLCSNCHRGDQEESSGTHGDRWSGGRREVVLPEGYLKLGYFGEDGHPRKEILIEEARAMAELLANSDLAAGKLQGLYTRVRILKDRVNQTGDFAAIRSDIYGLLTDAADSTGRKITPEVFLRFVERNVELATVDAKSFREGLVEHLRGVRAWFLLARAKPNRGRR